MKSLIVVLAFIVLVNPLSILATDLHPVSQQVLDSCNSIHTRLKAIQNLSSPLSEEEGERLLALLAMPPKSDTGIDEFGLATIKNDLTGVLGKDGRFVDRLADILIDGAVDSEQGLVWRNYCVQYFPYIYPKCTLKNQTRLDSATRIALGDPKLHIAGSALIAMKKLNFTKEQLLASAWQLYSAPEVSNGNKMTAFLILGENGDRCIIHEARRILKENKGSVDIRMSSMSILGKQGIASDLPLLESFLDANDIRLRKAAGLNIKTLKKRLTEQK